MTRTRIRIVAGSLRGRPLAVDVHPGLRPTPQRVREALFSILGHSVPDRAFVDVFAGTGVHGLEALSRGASKAIFVERDGRLAGAIDASLSKFGLVDRGQVIRGDVYRWADRWLAPKDAINVFVSPPFADLTQRSEEFANLISGLQSRVEEGSVLTVQLEEGFDLATLPDSTRWDTRKYGRNILAFWELAENADAI
jgi:16S rRNA (guanine(966)-N(2))-methyltransferase RsmD